MSDNEANSGGSGGSNKKMIIIIISLVVVVAIVIAVVVFVVKKGLLSGKGEAEDEKEKETTLLGQGHEYDSRLRSSRKRNSEELRDTTENVGRSNLGSPQVAKVVCFCNKSL